MITNEKTIEFYNIAYLQQYFERTPIKLYIWINSMLHSNELSNTSGVLLT